MTHSQLPWEVFAELNVENEEGEFVASCGVNGKIEKSRANASFIVRCVNNHERLISVCKKAMAELIFPACGQKHSKLYEELQQALQSAERLD